MHVLVTGGAGFIGSKVTRHLLDLGHEVSICDNLATGEISNIDKRAKFIEAGAESPQILNFCESERIDAIAHIGGNSSGEIGEMEPLNDISWNVVSTLNLLNVAQKLKINKFVYASSMGVYGQSDGARSLKETDSEAPISIYGAGKYCSERYLQTFASRGVNSIALRLFNVYGPGQNLKNPRQGMISIYMEQRLRGPKVIVRGSTDRVRDFVYIDDVVKAWELALLKKDHVGFAAVNISTGLGTKVVEVLDQIGTNAGSFEMEVQGSTPADQHAVIGDNSKAATFLGWTPETNLNDGISKMWAWAVCQKNTL
jgi:UDP-glucose 4-epimerase